jgi:hypothetical protein
MSIIRALLPNIQSVGVWSDQDVWLPPLAENEWKIKFGSRPVAYSLPTKFRRP